MSESFQSYVLGFHFSESRKLVTLLQKRRGPASLYGMWNGVGGKVEAGEDPGHAMSREFREEAGLSVHQLCWQHRGRIERPNICEIHLYRTFDLRAPQRRGSEPVRQFEVDRLHLNPDLTPDVRWLIPLMLDDASMWVEVQSGGR